MKHTLESFTQSLKQTPPVPCDFKVGDIMSNSPNAFPIIVAIVAFIATFGILEHYMPTRRNNPKW